MKRDASKPIDGGRRRCTGCGHPFSEHRWPAVCTVPKCPCQDYVAAEAKPSS